MADFIPEPPARPRVDELGFDHRLMTPERLLELGGKWPMRYTEVDGEFISLDCRVCGKAIEILTNERGESYVIGAGQILANVVRHRVMRHNLSLSGGGDNGGS